MLKRLFITGLAALIPLVITIYVIIGLFNFADGVLGKPINKFIHKYVGHEIPGIGILLVIIIIFMIGILIHLSRMKVFRWLTRGVRNAFFRIPVVSKIYSPVKRMVDFLFFPPRRSFKTAVLVEYPRKGIRTLGFLTNENTLQFKDRKGKKLYNVFIPSSPSPITGFTIVVEEDDLTYLDISVEEALRVIVSGGLLNP